MTFGANALVLCGVFAACSVRGGPAPKVSNRPPPPETAALIDARCRGPGKDACLLAWRQLDGVGGVREHELELASRIIAVGGWLCYAFSLELIGGASWSEAFAADARMHVGIKAMCGESAAVRSADQGVVVVWHHNGLGNQIWECVACRAHAAARRRRLPLSRGPRRRSHATLSPLPPLRPGTCSDGLWQTTSGT